MRRGRAPEVVAATFVSGAIDRARLQRRLVSGRQHIAISGTRGLTRSSLLHDRATAPVDVDPVDGRVTLHRRALDAAPVDEVPLNRRYFLR